MLQRNLQGQVLGGGMGGFQGGSRPSRWQFMKTRGFLTRGFAISGWPRFGSVRLRFGDGTVRAVPVFGSGGSSKEGVLCVSAQLHREDGSGFGFGSWKTQRAQRSKKI